MAARGGQRHARTDVVGAHGPQTGHGGTRALILQWYRRRMGITVVRAMARHRWRHSQYVGLTRERRRSTQAEADREPWRPEPRDERVRDCRFELESDSSLA